MLKQQILGVINLSLPLILLYYVYPALLFCFSGQVFCAVLLAGYVYYLNRKSAKNLVASLRYVPTQQHKEYLEALLASCGYDSKRVSLNYAYTNEQIAMAVYSTIIVDPIVWSITDEDPSALQVKDIFDKYIEPGLTQNAKMRINGMRQILSPAAQRFIFRHELGHVAYNFSYKKLCVLFFTSFCAAYAGIISAIWTLHLGGILALLIGMIVGGISDIVLTYASNVFFKLREEKRADIFAAQHSSAEEIEAAAQFFEQHQNLVDTYKEPNSLLAYLPSSVLTGHPDGINRASYLRDLVNKKTI
jgi:hypothetical protein